MTRDKRQKVPKQGKLYLVATPIGNLDDISFRAVKVLKEVDVIAAEDTRKSRVLLEKYDIHTSMVSYHKFNEIERATSLIARIKKGENIAIVSDGGTPGISDPAREIVKLSVEMKINIVPVPGPSAAISALVASGLESTSFSFYGFLPKKESKMIKFFSKIKTRQETSIFYESPRRITATLEKLKQVLGNRKIVVAKELTKIYEHFFRGTASDVMEMLNEENLKGEFVLLVSGSEELEKMDDTAIKELLKKKLALGITKSSAAKEIAEQYDLRRNRVYKLSLEI